MKKIHFSKYQGAGNDFIMLDNFSGVYDFLTVAEISKLCDRRFGIGADGLILISNCAESDFFVDYFNADGSKSFCGNGARCSVRYFIEKISSKTIEQVTFTAIDGQHTGEILNNQVKIDMKDVLQVKALQSLHFELNTGSPHLLLFQKNIENENMVEIGRYHRYAERYLPNGINVNLVEVIEESHLKIRTYERGVEDETLACGTGVTAAALAYHSHFMNETNRGVYKISAVGGNMEVIFDFSKENGYQNIFLIGPAVHVFDGSVDVE